MHRRKFVRDTALWAGTATLLPGCLTGTDSVRAFMRPDASAVGHLLRSGNFGELVSESAVDVVIVGGGVSGLSAGRALKRQGIQFTLLELDPALGGNAVSGGNELSAYPWGAHYLPLPNNDLTEYLTFLEEAGAITGWDAAGLPVYNEYHLCAQPEERLYINGRWQDGLVPQYGVPPAEAAQIRRFLDQMTALKSAKGRDGKDAFTLPLDGCSTDPDFIALDAITMERWMEQNGYNSPYLCWYASYCCRDDYGTDLHEVSAWAGLHYFCCRKGRGANASSDEVLTWPEGNAWAVAALAKDVKEDCHNGHMAVKIEYRADEVWVDVYDVATKTLSRLRAAQCIVAVPQMVAARLLRDDARIKTVRDTMAYVPWMVANLKVSPLEERQGAPPSWDNVIFGAEGLGYVSAAHQLVQREKSKRNLTYYFPITTHLPGEARAWASQKTAHDWARLIIDDLQKVHPNIAAALSEVTVQLWGHAMAQPKSGWLHGATRQQLKASLHGVIHFAHTDLAGLSLFEDAFYAGRRAADEVKRGLIQRSKVA